MRKREKPGVVSDGCKELSRIEVTYRQDCEGLTHTGTVTGKRKEGEDDDN